MTENPFSGETSKLHAPRMGDKRVWMSAALSNPALMRDCVESLAKIISERNGVEIKATTSEELIAGVNSLGRPVEADSLLTDAQIIEVLQGASAEEHRQEQLRNS